MSGEDKEQNDATAPMKAHEGVRNAGGSPQSIPGDATYVEPGIGTTPLVGGRFQIRKELGHGGIGVAYLATDLLDNDALVVVKLLLERFEGKDKEWVESHFREEMKALSRIDH